MTCPEAFDGLVHHKNKVKVKLSRGNKLPFRLYLDILLSRTIHARYFLRCHKRLQPTTNI